MRFRYRGIEFGGPHGSLLVPEFDPGTTALRSSDQDRPQRDGTLPGQDFFGGRTWGFVMRTNGETLSDALALSEALEDQWTDDEVRLTPGRLEPLSYELDGRWRRVYGRPGPFVGPIGDVRARQGSGSIVADFRVMDPYHYSEEEKQVVMAIVPASVGGLTSPLRAPLTSLKSGAARVGTVYNQGNRPTPLKVTFQGPITDPKVTAAAGWEIGLKGSLAYDQSVTVDSLAGTVRRSDGAAVPGMLTTATLLSLSRMPKGRSELTFRGNDSTGTATATLRWRDAYKSL